MKLAAALSFALAAALVAPVTARAQTSTGTATITGIVVDDAADPKPVRRVVVSLSGADLKPSRGAITDDDGKFTIANLPAGRFTLTAARAAFVTSMYGAKRPGRPGTAIAVGDGQHVDVRVTIWRGAAIAGVVRDERGLPVEGMRVTATPSRPPASTLLTLTNNGALTNARGEYRIFGLEPGIYVVSVKPMATSSGVLIALQDADVDAAFDAIRAHSTAPPMGAVSTGAANGHALVPFDYAPIFFPGTPRRSLATPIPLGAGQEADGIDLQLERVNTSTIEGIVVAPGGQPLSGAFVQLTPSPGAYVTDTTRPITAYAGRDGRFSIPQLAPGDYDLLATGSISGASDSDSSGPRAGLWAHASVSIAGGDLRELTLSLLPGALVEGQLRLETTPSGAAALPDVSKWRVALVVPEELHRKYGTPQWTMTTASGGSVAADGTFALSSIAPVTQAMTVFGPEVRDGTWRIKSAILNGRDLLDRPFDLAAGTGGTLVVTATTKHSTATGRLQTSSGAPASDVFVIAFAKDASLWGPGARRVRAVRPDVDGRYHFDDLPPGEYRIAAVTDVDPDEWQDPTFLAALVPASVAFTVGETDTQAPTLRIGG